MLVDEEGVPRYGRAVIDDLLRADFVQVVGWLRLSTARQRRMTQRSSGFVFQLFCKYVESRYRAAPDPFEVVDCEGLFAGTEPESIQILSQEANDTDPGKLSSRLREFGPDVVVDLSSAALRRDVLRYSAVWTLAISFWG